MTFTSGSLLIDCYLAGTSEHCALYSRDGPFASPPRFRSQAYQGDCQSVGAAASAGKPALLYSGVELSPSERTQNWPSCRGYSVRVPACCVWGAKKETNKDNSKTKQKRSWIAKTLRGGRMRTFPMSRVNSGCSFQAAGESPGWFHSL